MILSKNFNQEEINVHKAVQLISLSGVNLLDKLPDDSQNTAVWEEKSSMILGRAFELNQNAYHLGVRLHPFELVIINSNSKIIYSEKLGTLSETELYCIWEEWLNKLGHKGKLITKLHYDLPTTELYSNKKISGLSDDFVETWHNTRSLANCGLQQLNKVTGIVSEINIWPHHFDTGVYYSISEESGETTQSVGAGLAMADSLVDEPYFYIYGWTKNGAINYEEAPTKAHALWLTDSWQGAVLKLSEVSSEYPQNSINSFFKTAFQFLEAELIKNK